MAEWPRQWYSWGFFDLKDGLLMPSNQPQKTGMVSPALVTLMVALSSIPWPPKHWKESLWWPICGQSARYSVGLRVTVEPSGLVATKVRAVGIIQGAMV